MENKEKTTIKEMGNLVRLLDLDDSFIIDLKYATPNNFTGAQVYKSDECYVDKHTAMQLVEAHKLAKSMGYRMKVWDAYRPISAQVKFWELLPNDDYVARPPDMSKPIEFRNSHMNGQCVDVTLTDLEGNEIPMPSEFDEFSSSSRLDCETTSSKLKKNGLLLQEIMVKSGFTPYVGEWWHFYDRNTDPVPYSDYDI